MSTSATLNCQIFNVNEPKHRNFPRKELTNRQCNIIINYYIVKTSTILGFSLFWWFAYPRQNNLNMNVSAQQVIINVARSELFLSLI